MFEEGLLRGYITRYTQHNRHGEEQPSCGCCTGYPGSRPDPLYRQNIRICMKLDLRRNRNKDSLHRDNIYAKQPPRENYVMQ